MTVKGKKIDVCIYRERCVHVKKLVYHVPRSRRGVLKTRVKDCQIFGVRKMHKKQRQFQMELCRAHDSAICWLCRD